MAFNRDPPICRIASNDACNLVHTASALRRQFRAIELKIDIGKIDHNPAAGLTGLKITSFQFVNERLIFSDVSALLVNGFLLLGLFHFLALKLIADQSTSA
jgi:hypothetical protein